MASTMLKPNRTSSTNDPIGAILNRARSTLNQSRQFRDPSDKQVKQPSLLLRPPKPEVISTQASKLLQNDNRSITKTSNNNNSRFILDLDKHSSTTTNSIDDLLGRTKTILEQKKSRNRKGDGVLSNPPVSDVAPPPAVPQSTKSAANYDYDSIFSNVTSSKRVGRSDFNIFNVQNASSNVGGGSSAKLENLESFVGLQQPPPEKVKIKTSNPRMTKKSSNLNNSQNQRDDAYHENEDRGDDDSQSAGSSSYESSYTTGDSTEEENDDDGSTTITPPTITETYSKSVSNSAPLKAITLGDENDYRAKPTESKKSRKLKVQDLKDRPLVFLSEESHAVFKAMSPDEDEKSSPANKQYDNNTSPKSYTEDFVSEIQSVADNFSRTFARSVSMVEDSIEVPQTESDTVSEIPLELEGSESGGESSQRSVSHRKLSVKNAINSLRIVKEIQGNLQDLEISDRSGALSEDESEANKASEQASATTNNEYSDDLVINGAEIMTSTNTSGGGKVGKKSDSLKTSGSASGISKSSKLSSAKNLGQQKAQKSSTTSQSGIEIDLSRQSSRKAFQAALSQVKLQDELPKKHVITAVQQPPPLVVADQEKDKPTKKTDPVYQVPQTKPQTQIHSILEKEVYRKELNRLRKIHQREDKEIQKINEVRLKNYKTVKELEKGGRGKFRQPKIDFPAELETDLSSSGNWGAPYFNLDGSLSQGYRMENLPRTPDENYGLQVSNMDVPQLVREVVKSNERMYKMTIRAAKEMSKEYGKDVKLARKIRQDKLVKSKVLKN
ncbi:putative mediator of RNA polymerase II transcription subunit 26 [Folsomia candida]|nr:putative mediator of RNA polymerase II transcription subunit 26 [Folsomia candida]